MNTHRIKTKTAAKILGVTSPFLMEKMRTGEWNLGDYRKNGGRATVYIYAPQLARHMERSLEDIDAAVIEIEGKEER